jgi:hypothetical protein
MSVTSQDDLQGQRALVTGATPPSQPLTFEYWRDGWATK